jgi:hypothetical protein
LTSFWSPLEPAAFLFSVARGNEVTQILDVESDSPPTATSLEPPVTDSPP